MPVISVLKKVSVSLRPHSKYQPSLNSIRPILNTYGSTVETCIGLKTNSGIQVTPWQ